MKELEAAVSLPLNQCDQECDLGVAIIYSLDLKFNQHVHRKIQLCKAKSVIGIIKRSFNYLLRQDYVSHPLHQFGSPPFRILH